MSVSSATDDGVPIRCELCGRSSIVNVSRPPGDSVCPHCGCFLWVQAISEMTSQYQFIPDIRLRELTARNKPDAIREITEAIGSELDWDALQTDHFVKSIMQREQICSTSIGNGIAVPHARTEWVDRCVTAVALAPEGIDFGSLDGMPVHTLIMIASPTSKPHDHLRLLERISRTIRSIGPSFG